MFFLDLGYTFIRYDGRRNHEQQAKCNDQKLTRSEQKRAISNEQKFQSLLFYSYFLFNGIAFEQIFHVQVCLNKYLESWPLQKLIPEILFLLFRARYGFTMVRTFVKGTIRTFFVGQLLQQNNSASSFMVSIHVTTLKKSQQTSKQKTLTLKTVGGSWLSF